MAPWDPPLDPPLCSKESRCAVGSSEKQSKALYALIEGERRICVIAHWLPRKSLFSFEIEGAISTALWRYKSEADGKSILVVVMVSPLSRWKIQEL